MKYLSFYCNPLYNTLYELSKVDGIPNGAEVLERKEHQLKEHLSKASKKRINSKNVPSFAYITLRHKDWERVEYVEPIGELTINTILKWEYPSKVEEYSKWLDLQPDIVLL